MRQTRRGPLHGTLRGALRGTLRRRPARLALAGLLVTLIGACSAPGANVESRGETATAAPAPADPTPTANPNDAVRDPTSWVLYPDEIHGARLGMTGAAVRTALQLPPADDPERKMNPSCYYLHVPSLPVSAYFMMNNDALVRIEVRDSTVATADGAHVGDTEAQIASLYPGRVTTEPHKYTGPVGHYLNVTVPSDTSLLLVFETDGKVVTRYRAGRKPEVLMVEGCS